MPGKVSSGPKRLTLDLPVQMHRTLKIGAAEHDVTMVDLVRCLLADVLADPKRFDQVAVKARQGRATNDPAA